MWRNDYDRMRPNQPRWPWPQSAPPSPRPSPGPSSGPGTTYLLPRPPRSALFTLLKFTVPLALLSLLLALTLWIPHVEIAFYSRKWVTQEVKTLHRLSDACFDPEKVAREGYNLTAGLYGKKTTLVHAGMPLRLGMDCYDFAGTIPPPAEGEEDAYIPPEQRTQFHTYWRTDLVPFGDRQEWMLKSFFATQNPRRSRLVLWSNGELASHPTVQRYLRIYPDSFVAREVEYERLVEGTELEGRQGVWAHAKDRNAWVDGDLVRLLVLWKEGGVWVDMDTLLTRSVEPLLEHEFVTQWDCYDKLYTPFNGALMHFRRHSPYLCEALHIIGTSPPPRSSSTDWGSTLYLKLWRRLVASSIPPFSVLPFCFSDARACRLDNRLPDPFVPDAMSMGGIGAGEWGEREEGGRLDGALGKVFAVHLHNQWGKVFPRGGWVERLLLRRYEERLAGAEIGMEE